MRPRISFIMIMTSAFIISVNVGLFISPPLTPIGLLFFVDGVLPLSFALSAMYLVGLFKPKSRFVWGFKLFAGIALAEYLVDCCLGFPIVERYFTWLGPNYSLSPETWLWVLAGPQLAFAVIGGFLAQGDLSGPDDEAEANS